MTTKSSAFTSCTRAMNFVATRSSRAECEKAHKRFIQQLQRSARLLSAKKEEQHGDRR